MLADVRLIVTPTETRLTVKHGETLVEDEVWTHARRVSQTEAREVARGLFDQAYDIINYVVNGDDE